MNKEEVYLCLNDDECPEVDCKLRKETNVYISGHIQYGYFRHSELCPLFMKERKEKQK